MASKLLLAFLLPVSALAANYDDAISHAKDAAYIQTGAAAFVSQVQDYGKQQARLYGDKLGITPEAKLAASAYFIYRKRQIPIAISNSCKLTLHTDSLLMEYHW